VLLELRNVKNNIKEKFEKLSFVLNIKITKKRIVNGGCKKKKLNLTYENFRPRPPFYTHCSNTEWKRQSNIFVSSHSNKLQ